MKKPWMAATALAVVVAALWISRDRGEQTLEEAAAPPALTDQALSDRVPPPPGETGPARKVLRLDPARLFERGYENDPDLQAVAKRAGVSTACLIAEMKQALHQIAAPEGLCPPLGASEDIKTLAVGTNHPYNRYSNAELESLATAEPAAAVILARRTESDAEARKWYERAVALSGITEPLIEWMYDRGPGALSWTDGVLDVNSAKEGYKTLLVVTALGGYEDPIIETYQRELEEEGVDLEPVEQAAAADADRLRQERDELTGERP